jgi:hypothetical protein
MTMTPFEHEVAARLRELAESAPATPSHHHDDQRHAPEGRRRAAVSAVMAAVVAVAVVAGVMAAINHTSRASEVRVQTPSTANVTGPTLAPNPQPVTGGQAPDTATKLPPAPIEGRIGPAAVWTGHEMLIWSGSELKSGGAGGEIPLDDGAAFDPRTNQWRLIATAPIEPRAYAAVVWTGREMVVWGGGSDGRILGDGAAYNPVSDRWRRIAKAPIPGAMTSAVVWTGQEMLIVGGLHGGGGGVHSGGTPSVVGAAYDPSSDRWHQTSPAPAALLAPYPSVTWTGTEAVHILQGSAGLGSSPRLYVYKPDTDQWKDLGPTPGDPSLGRQLVWTGEVALGVTLSVGTPQITYRPSTGEIAQLPGPPAGTPPVMATTTIWSGREALLWSGGTVGSAFDPATHVWRTFPAGDVTGRVDGAVVWADGVLIAWGGFVFDDGNGSPTAAADGVIYRPPA